MAAGTQSEHQRAISTESMWPLLGAHLLNSTLSVCKVWFSTGTPSSIYTQSGKIISTLGPCGPDRAARRLKSTLSVWKV